MSTSKFLPYTLEQLFALATLGLTCDDYSGGTDSWIGVPPHRPEIPFSIYDDAVTQAERLLDLGPENRRLRRPLAPLPLSPEALLETFFEDECAFARFMEKQRER
jgi:hypothetical protein